MENDLKKLEKYESWFLCAIKSDYTKALWKSDFDILIPIYKKWTNESTTNINFGCSTCKLNFIKKLGKIYFKKKEEYGTHKDNEQPDGKKKELQQRSGATIGNRQGSRNSKATGKGSKSKNHKV